jgi:uncharacterized protein (TIGR02001 family)
MVEVFLIRKFMKKLLIALALLSSFSAAHAEVTGNLGLTSDYRYRGISQTQNAPAVQGGVDYTHSSGFYVGNWNSSVSSQVYTNGAGVESDLYAGWKKDVYKGITVDVGSYNYFYPRSTTSAKTGSNFDTYEAYAAIGYKELVTAKLSQTLGNGYFGTANAKNTKYYQADAKLPVAIVNGLSVVAHAGRTNISNSSAYDYTDYNAGFAYALPQAWEGAVKYYTTTGLTNTAKAANTVSGQKLYNNAVVVSVTKTF